MARKGRRSSGSGQAWQWAARHPKTSGLIVLAVVVFSIIGSVADGGEAKQAAGARAPKLAGPATAPARPTPGSVTASPAGASKTNHARKRPRATVSAAAVDRRQRSGSTAIALLHTIRIKGRAPMTGYSRDQFGSAWTDDNDDPLGHNGCDTRNDVLGRDLTGITIKRGSKGCTVLTGVLRDPYTGRTIAFTRGIGTSEAVQIDHVVALGDAWQTGAHSWTLRTRTDLADDPLNLLAVDGPANESKGDGDDATWLPPNKAYRCAYVARQVAVKARYGLWMTAAEYDAARRIVSRCPDQRAPGEPGAAMVSRRPEPPRSTARQTTAPPPAADAYYDNCSAARAAGAAPLLRGQTGYRPELDRDGDGVACET